ncbi:hypothetical protein Tco_0419328 [Tanacetum coccineum]
MKGCKPSLDASWDWFQAIFSCQDYLSYIVLKVDCLWEWVRFGLCVLGCTPSMLKRPRMLNFGILKFWYASMNFLNSLMGVWDNTSRVRLLAAFIFGDIRYWCCLLSYISIGSIANGISVYGILGIWGSRFFGKGLGSVCLGSANFNLGFDHIIASDTGF